MDFLRRVCQWIRHPLSGRSIIYIAHQLLTVLSSLLLALCSSLIFEVYIGLFPPETAPPPAVYRGLLLQHTSAFLHGIYWMGFLAPPAFSLLIALPGITAHVNYLALTS